MAEFEVLLGMRFNFNSFEKIHDNSDITRHIDFKKFNVLH